MRFTFDYVPKSLAEFQNLASYNLTEPRFAAAAFALCLMIYCDDRKLAIELINHLKGPQPLTVHDERFLNDRLADKPYLGASYFAGASKQNNYQPTELTVEVVEDARSFAEEGYAKFFIKSAGADSARPITVRQKGNQYFLWEYSSILLSIVKPASQDVWA